MPEYITKRWQLLSQKKKSICSPVTYEDVHKKSHGCEEMIAKNRFEKNRHRPDRDESGPKKKQKKSNGRPSRLM